MKVPSRGLSPGPFLRLLHKLEGEKSDFLGMGGRNAATHTQNPEKGKQHLCENRVRGIILKTEWVAQTLYKLCAFLLHIDTIKENKIQGRK